MDPYKILRIRPGASKNEIEEAASRMLNIWNPDKFDEYKSVAQKVLRDINKAKNMLLYPERRINFDKMTKHETGLPSKVAIYTSSGSCVKYKRPWISCIDNKGRQTNDFTDSNQIALDDFGFVSDKYEQFFERDLLLETTQKLPSNNVIYDSSDSMSDVTLSKENTKLQTFSSDSTFELEKYDETSNSTLTDSAHDIENYLWMENTDKFYILKEKKNPFEFFTSKSDTFLLPAKDKTSQNKNNIKCDINISLFDTYVVVNDDLMVNENGFDPDYLKEMENSVKNSQSDNVTSSRNTNLKVESIIQTDEKSLSLNKINNGGNVLPSFIYTINRDNLQTVKDSDSGLENEKEMTHNINNCCSDSATSFRDSSLKLYYDTQMHEFGKYYVNKRYSSDESRYLKESDELEKKSNVNGRVNDDDIYTSRKDDLTIKSEKSDHVEFNSDQNVLAKNDLGSNHLSSDQNQSNNLTKNKITDHIKYDEYLNIYIKGLKTSLSEICIPKNNVKETFNNKQVPVKESPKSEQQSSFESENSNNQSSYFFLNLPNIYVNDPDNSSQDHKDFPTEITGDMCIQDISALNVKNVKLIKSKKGCLLKCTTWVDTQGKSKIDISDLKALSKTSYYEDQEWQVIRSSVHLEGFEMVNIYRFSSESESLSVLLEDNLTCGIINDDPIEISTEYWKTSEFIPLTMTTIIKANNNILKITRIRENENDCIQIFKNGLLICALENQLAED